MPKQQRVLIMAGGTGGHVIPALSVAAELRQRGVAVHWLGTRAGIEATLVPAAGIPIHWLSIGGLRGKGKATLALAPFKLAYAVLQALILMLKLRPQAVLGMGGFASGPGGIAAVLSGRRLVIHEQNAIAGMTNRWLAKCTRHVACAFNGALKGQHIPNPVRKDIAALAGPAERAALNGKAAINVLILGGSQGAVALNETVPQALTLLAAEESLVVRHQCGQRHVDTMRGRYADFPAEFTIEPFIDDMAAAYSWADLVICRSGALTVAELAAAGVASVLIPFPFAVDDHQTKNGQALADVSASIVVQQRDMTAESLASTLRPLITSAEARLEMAEAARELAEPNAAYKLATLCLPALDTLEVQDA